jgi:hypothetical protein
MRDVRAVDTTIFNYGDKWWMLTNIDSSNIGDYDSELHLFYSDKLDSSEWRPHRANPVVFDSMRGRNGGFIYQDGSLYRVFQVQGFDMYGESMGVALVKDIRADCYVEEVILTIPARFFDDIIGTHTLSFHKGVLAIDFVKKQRCKT